MIVKEVILKSIRAAIFTSGCSSCEPPVSPP